MDDSLDFDSMTDKELSYWLISPPGSTVQDLIEEMDLDTTKLEKRLDLPLKSLIQGDLEITEEVAKKLEDEFTISVSFWLNAEERYWQRLYEIEKMSD